MNSFNFVINSSIQMSWFGTSKRLLVALENETDLVIQTVSINIFYRLLNALTGKDIFKSVHLVKRIKIWDDLTDKNGSNLTNEQKIFILTKLKPQLNQMVHSKRPINDIAHEILSSLPNFETDSLKELVNRTSIPNYSEKQLINTQQIKDAILPSSQINEFVPKDEPPSASPAQINTTELTKSPFSKIEDAPSNEPHTEPNEDELLQEQEHEPKEKQFEQEKEPQSDFQQNKEPVFQLDEQPQNSKETPRDSAVAAVPAKINVSSSEFIIKENSTRENGVPEKLDNQGDNDSEGATDAVVVQETVQKPAEIPVKTPCGQPKRSFHKVLLLAGMCAISSLLGFGATLAAHALRSGGSSLSPVLNGVNLTNSNNPNCLDLDFFPRPISQTNRDGSFIHKHQFQYCRPDEYIEELFHLRPTISEKVIVNESDLSVKRLESFLDTGTDIIDPGLYAHVVGHKSSAIKNGEVEGDKLEGGDPRSMIIFQRQIAESILKATAKHPIDSERPEDLCCSPLLGEIAFGSRLWRNEHALNRLIAQYKWAEMLDQRDFDKFTKNIQDSVEKLSKGTDTSFFFSGGWGRIGGGHGIVWEVSRQPNGKLTIRIYNTGLGIKEHHNSRNGSTSR